MEQIMEMCMELCSSLLGLGGAEEVAEEAGAQGAGPTMVADLIATSLGQISGLLG
jgi:hypothetical protein